MNHAHLFNYLKYMYMYDTVYTVAQKFSEH